eukprot:8867453-Pyramimonas_sp.AAC.1
MLDGASRFQKCRIVARETSAEAIKSIEKAWIKHYGTPTRLVMDECGAARSQEMLDWASNQNIRMRIAPGEAHHVLGPVERAHQVTRETLDQPDQQDDASQGLQSSAV